MIFTEEQIIESNNNILKILNKNKENLEKIKSLDNTIEIPVNDENIRKFKNNYRFLSHIRTGPDYEGTIFLDNENNNKIIGIINIRKSDRFIQALEISKEYRGFGLGKQLLQYAVNVYGARKLSVNINNKIAIKLYKNNGWKEIQTNGKMIIMEL